MFETAVFTDVSPEEALDGRGGFNFQAASPGFTDADERLAVESMLHRVSPTRDDAPSGETFCYRPEGSRFYFSRGHGLGSTASGRSGNQVTEIIVTGSADDFEPYTPAHVFAARGWDVSKRPSKVSHRWQPPLDIDDAFESENLLAWVLDDPARRTYLPTLLATFESKATGTSSGPLILVARELGELVRWVAVASLLSNPQAARSLSMRAFDADPLQCDADIVGCTPDVGRTIAPSPLLCDLDLLTGGSTRQSFSVERTMALLTDREAYEAVDIVALARRWDPVIGAQPAFWASELVHGTLSERSLVAGSNLIVDVVEGLTRGGLAEDLTTYLEEFGDAVRRLPRHQEDDIIRLTRSAGLLAASTSPALAAILLEGTMRDVETEPRRIRGWATELLAAGRDPWPTTGSTPSHWGEALGRLARRAQVDDLPLLFALSEYLPQDSLEPRVWDGAQRSLRDLARAQPRSLELTQHLRIGGVIREGVREGLLMDLENSLRTWPGLLGPGTSFDALRRGAWEPLVRGSHGDLTDSARSLATWARLADLANETPRRRRSALASSPDLRPHLWKGALAGTDPHADHELWEAWVQKVGPDPGLVDTVVGAVDRALDAPPTKDLKNWLGLLQSIDERVPGPDGRRCRDLAAEVQEQLETVGMLGGRVRSWVPGRRGSRNSGSPGGSLPPPPEHPTGGRRR